VLWDEYKNGLARRDRHSCIIQAIRERGRGRGRGKGKGIAAL